MSALDWKVGDKLVCVDQGRYGSFIQNGTTYTIRAIDRTYVYFEEPSTCGAFGPEFAGYRHRRFRKVLKRTTDISVFTALLNPSERDREYIELEDLEHSEPRT